MAAPLPVPAEPAEAADGGPRLYGVIDVLRADRVSGWAIDRTDPAAAVEIEVLREGVVIARVRADRERRDLARGGVGSGRYGFSVPLEPPLEPGFEFTLSVRARSADDATAELRRAGATISTPDPNRRLLERTYEELRALAARPAPEPSRGPDQAILELAARLELTQIRIEAALAAVEPPRRPDAGGLRLVAGAALAIACGSLTLGFLSLWAG